MMTKNNIKYPAFLFYFVYFFLYYILEKQRQDKNYNKKQQKKAKKKINIFKEREVKKIAGSKID